MANKNRRVIVWGTGTIGMPGLRHVIEHPELELVGLHAWSPNKIGRDAGDLAGTGKTGVLATNDVEALLNLNADCLAHFGNGALREAEVNAEIIPFLKRGTNVVTCSMMDIVNPKFGRPEYVEPLAKACREGGSSIFGTGIEPGYATTGFPISLLSIAGEIDQITIGEIADISAYTGVESLKLYGFGEPLDFKPPMFTDPVGRAWHESTVSGLAHYLGVELDECKGTWETAGLDHDYKCAFGVIKAGCTVATRWTITGMSNGKPFIVWKKIERLHNDAGRDWEYGSIGDGEAYWFCDVKGSPSFKTEINVDIVGAVSFTSLHPVNSIPAVCDAPTGIIDPLKLPIFYSTNVAKCFKRVLG